MDQIYAQLSETRIVAEQMTAWALDAVPNLITAILVLILGWLLAGWAGRSVRRLLAGVGTLNQALPPILDALTRYGLLIVTLVVVLGEFGVQTTSILAVLGAAGLAIGLALQGTLSNIAAGIMLLWLRPFQIGDYIDAGGVAGTVEELNLFHSQIRTWDGIFKFVPNAQLWNTTLTNYTRNPTRLVLLEFGIGYDDDLAEGRRLLTAMAQEHEEVLEIPEPVTVPLRLDDNAVVLQLRAWAPTATFWDTSWDLRQEGKKRLEAAGFTIPFPQRTVHFDKPAEGGA
jgi:small conductance mechanosensitive channel